MERPHTAKKRRQLCCFCKKEIIGFGNNAQPVRDGQCCDECNLSIVIPARMIAFMNSESRRKQ